MAEMPTQVPDPARGFSGARHGLARALVTSSRMAPVIARVAAAPRKSLAWCAGGLCSSSKARAVNGSEGGCAGYRRLMRADLRGDLILQWIPPPARAVTGTGLDRGQYI